MRHHPHSSHKGHRAAIFVDYENLFTLLAARVDDRRYPDELIAEIVDELRRYLADEEDTQTAVTQAYADFSAIDGDGPFIQRSLYLQGAEPRFVPAALQDNAVEIQLSVDATDVLHHRPDVDTFVLVTGDRAYLPLVQHFRRYGRRTLVVALDAPALADDVRLGAEDVFLDALNLLSDDSFRDVSAADGASGDAPDGNARNGAAAVPFTAVEDPVALQTLGIVEEHFGQYDEVYLTPLLRKLSELLDERQHDPKALISILEECGAVRLEKRRGFPYDYTVLIVEPEHPDVKRVRGPSLDGVALDPLPEDATNGHSRRGVG